MTQTSELIESCELGKACMLGDIVGRIVGNADEGSWGYMNGNRLYSILMFATPHGTIIKTGVIHLTEISEEGRKQLEEYEKELNGKETYAGKLNKI